MKKRTLLFGIISGLFLTAVPIKVQAQNEIISYIYHQHQGTAERKGSCYNQPLYHIHNGNEKTGGGCYGRAVYHIHEGNGQDGGGCFSVPVYHIHQGNGTAREGCYVEQYHTHTSECYTTVNCSMRVAARYDLITTYYARCYHHGEVVHGRWNVKVSHSACGQGESMGVQEVCNSCRHDGMGSHTFNKLICTRENTVESYILGCGMDESTIVGYQAGCQLKEGEDIVGYTLSCPKTGESIDSYERNCGLETTVPLGLVKITNLTAGTADTVTLEASYWDNTGTKGRGGILQIGNDPFVWRDSASGEVIGEGSQITIRQNGNYSVTLQAVNQDIRKEGLSVTMNVANVKAAHSDSGNTGNGNTGDKNNDSHKGSGSQNDGAGPEVSPTADTGVINVSPSPATLTPAASPYRKQSILSGDRKEAAKATLSPVYTPIPYSSPRQAYENKGEMKEETVEETAWEAEGAAEEIVTQEVRSSFLSGPAAKAFVITLGGFITLLVLGGLWFLFFRYVGIYGDDGEGNDCFLGFGVIRKEETFLLVIPEHIMDKACTSRYYLRPGVLFYKIHEESELLIETKDRRISLPVEKEMKFKY